MAHSKPISLWPCYRKVCVWGLAAHCLKASKQVRLVEKKVCFISYAGNWQEQWQTSVQRPTFTPPWQAGGESFIDKVGGGLHAEIVQSSSHWSWVVWRVSSWLLSVQFSRSVMSDSFYPMDYSTPGFPVHHQLLQLAQTHVHWVGDAIQNIHWLFQVQFIFSAGVDLFPCLCGQFSELWMLRSWVQCGHHVVHCSTWCSVSIRSSQDMAQNIIHNPWERTKGPYCA